LNQEQFISNLSYWNSYLPLLWLALENTQGDVIELGVGDGSTQKLRDYCSEYKRSLFSYESNKEWYGKFAFQGCDWPDFHINARSAWCNLKYVGNNWDQLHEHWAHLQYLASNTRKLGVLFSDESPGEMRKYNISMFCNTAQIVVVHDSEQGNDHGYKLSLVAPLFKYRKDFEYPGASATAFSNFIDVSKWVLDQYKPAAIMSS
jgi:hypothetical protein